MFEGCQLTLELDSSIPFKKKVALKKSITENGGIISFIVTKKVKTVLNASYMYFICKSPPPPPPPPHTHTHMHAHTHTHTDDLPGGEQCAEGPGLVQESDGWEVGHSSCLHTVHC